jgi:hypothetical protein
VGARKDKRLAQVQQNFLLTPEGKVAQQMPLERRALHAGRRSCDPANDEKGTRQSESWAPIEDTVVEEQRTQPEMKKLYQHWRWRAKLE